MILKFQSKSKNQKYPQLIKKTKIMILATGKNNRVTAKAMSVINKGLNIMFQASKKSTKFEQMTHNHYVTLSAKNMQIEGIAKVRDHPMRDKEFLNLYKIYHHGSFLAYSQLEEEAVIEVKSFLITLYKYDNKIPFRYILEINEKLAYKIEVENTIRKIIK